MAQDTKPSFLISSEKPLITGGISSVPSVTITSEQSISLSASETDALQKDQGYTYNQAGFSYNEPGVFYGGIYRQNQDVPPSFTMQATLLNPSISSIIDAGSAGGTTPISNSGMLIGILGLTYP